MAKYAYIRVSTKEQNIDRQLVALKPYGIPEQNIYCDYHQVKILIVQLTKNFLES